MFQVGVVRGNYAKRSQLAELVQNSLGNGAAQHWLGSATKFVDEDERFFIAEFHKMLHVHQVRTVGAQVVFHRLLIANVDKKPAEDTCFASLADGD